MTDRFDISHGRACLCPVLLSTRLLICVQTRSDVATCSEQRRQLLPRGAHDTPKRPISAALFETASPGSNIGRDTVRAMLMPRALLTGFRQRVCQFLKTNTVCVRGVHAPALRGPGSRCVPAQAQACSFLAKRQRKAMHPMGCLERGCAAQHNVRIRIPQCRAGSARTCCAA